MPANVKAYPPGRTAGPSGAVIGGAIAGPSGVNDRARLSGQSSGHQTGSSRSRSSQASNISQASETTVNTLESNKSFNEIIRKISHDIYPLDELREKLLGWLSGLDDNYKHNKTWTREMEAAYNNYKREAINYSEALRDFKQTTAKQSSLTMEQNVERARLAVVKGNAAVRYVVLNSPTLSYTLRLVADADYDCRAASARLEFLKSYPTAYKHAQISGHIRQADTYIIAAREAVNDADKNYKGRFRRYLLN